MLPSRSNAIIDASMHHDIPLPPGRFKLYNGFNDWVKNKNKPRIERHKCRTRRITGYTCIEKDYFSSNSMERGHSKTISNNLCIRGLLIKHESLVPIRKLADHITGQTFSPVEITKVKESLRKLANMKSKKYFNYTLIDDDSFEKTLTPVQRQCFTKHFL